MPLCRKPMWVLIFAAGLAFGQSGECFGDGMNGPPKKAPRPILENDDTSDKASQPLLGAIRFFQNYISPIDGARCQFSPTCSAYGHQAIHRHGPWLGVLITADRLLRCGYGTDPSLYPQLPNGRLADPVAAIATE